MSMGKQTVTDQRNLEHQIPPRTRLAFVRPFAVYVINPIARLFAGWVPGFGILKYLGRKSGRRYRTPVNVFKRGDHFVFALTYGSRVDWVKNVLAAGGCEMRHCGRDIRLFRPEVFVDPKQRLMPAIVRMVLRLNKTTEFLRMRRA